MIKEKYIRESVFYTSCMKRKLTDVVKFLNISSHRIRVIHSLHPLYISA